MAGLENKKNTILVTINKMSTRIKTIKNKIDTFESRLNQTETAFNKRIENMSIMLIFCRLKTIL